MKWDKVGVEEASTMRAGLHEVERVAEGLKLVRMELGYHRTP